MVCSNCHAHVFEKLEDIVRFAREHLDMVDRDEIQTIAIQQYGMKPPKETDP